MAAFPEAVVIHSIPSTASSVRSYSHCASICRPLSPDVDVYQGAKYLTNR